MVFDHGVWAKYVASYLTAPFDFFDFAFEFQFLLLQFSLLFFNELGHKHFHCLFTVLDLATLVLALHYDTARQVSNAHGAIRLVDVLTACTATSIGVYLQVFGFDLDIGIVFYLGHNFQRRE